MPGLVVSERLSERGPIDLETVPYFGPAYHPGLAGCALRHLNAPLVVLSIVACPAGSVVRFNCSGFSSRFRPTFTRRTPREGAVSRSPGRQGLAIPLARYHLPAWMCSYENQSTLRQAQGQLFAAHPLSLRIVSSEQVAALSGTRVANTLRARCRANLTNKIYSRYIVPRCAPVGGRVFVYSRNSR